jgi:hypothetical protein
MKKTLLAAVFMLALAGCTVKESEDAEGDTNYDVDPAKVEVSTDSATIPVPDVDVIPDTTHTTTTN